MSMLYNIHTPNKTFAIQHKDGEEYSDLVSRIASKASLSKDDVTALKEGKDGAGLVYEFEGGRWSLEDDDDLQILFSRLPPSSTPSATFHLTPPHPHAHFSIPASPSKSGNTAASALKDKTRSPVKAKSAKKTSSSPLAQNGDTSPKALQDYSTGKAAAAGTQGRELGEAASTSPKDKKSESISAPSHHFPSSSHNGHPHEVLSDKKPNHVFGRGAPSIRSTASRRSKWGDDDAEPLWEVKKRAFYEFHNNQGVRTVTGKIGDVDNVRMLLQPGHKGVYVSRSFALKNNLVPKGYHMGGAGYTGLKMIGLVSITVAGKTQKHQAMVSEEEHFDVVLGRTWVERMSIKPGALLEHSFKRRLRFEVSVDPIDPTNLTYMDNGATIPVDIVVLKDDKGNKIHIT